MGNKGTGRKAFVYGANYLGRIIGNLAQYGTARVPEIIEGGEKGLNLGHPYAALGFAALDLIGGASDKLRESGYFKSTKLGGALVFSALAGKNLVDFIHGNYDGWKELPFNLSMAASLGYDLKEPGKDFFKNIKNWDWFIGKKKEEDITEKKN
jgi:hypothetical protein